MARRSGSMAIMAATGSCSFRTDRERAAEHHVGANSLRRLPRADQFEIPERVGDIADQDRTGQSPAGDHKLLVGAMIDIGEHDGLAAVTANEIACREHAYGGDVQIGCYDTTGV